MRLFVALEIPAEIRSQLSTLIDELRTLAPGLKWVHPNSLHLTLKFIGETDGAKLGAIRQALTKVRSGQAVEIQVRGLGFFPSERRPRVLWAGVQASSNLAQLAFAAELALVPLGFAHERRPFAPHLTLARLHGAPISPPLREALSRHTEREFGSFRATQFHLIESKLKSTGAEYTTVQSFSFISES